MCSKKLLVICSALLLLLLTACSYALSDESVPGNDVEFVSYTISDIKKIAHSSTYRVYLKLTYKNKSNSYVYLKDITLKSDDSNVAISPSSMKYVNGSIIFKAGSTFTIGDGTDLYIDVPMSYNYKDSIPIYWTIKSDKWASIGTISIKGSDIFPTAVNRKVTIASQTDNEYFELKGCKLIAENTLSNNDKYIYIDICLYNNGKSLSSPSLSLTTSGTGYDSENAYSNSWSKATSGKYWNLGASVNDDETYITNASSGFRIKISSDKYNSPITVNWKIEEVYGSSSTYAGLFTFMP